MEDLPFFEILGLLKEQEKGIVKEGMFWGISGPGSFDGEDEQGFFHYF